MGPGLLTWIVRIIGKNNIFLVGIFIASTKMDVVILLELAVIL